MPVSKARKRSKKHGQPVGAGHFRLSSQQDVLCAFGRTIWWSALVIAIAVLASSTLSDPLQRLAERGMSDAIHVSGAQDFTSYKQQERLALLRRTAEDADAVRHLSQEELTLLFGVPSLKRVEPEVESWHFVSVECALDVYFPHNRSKPVYAEYRVRGDALDNGIDESGKVLNHQSCVKSLFAHAKFADTNDYN